MREMTVGVGIPEQYLTHIAISSTRPALPGWRGGDVVGAFNVFTEAICKAMGHQEVSKEAVKGAIASVDAWQASASLRLASLRFMHSLSKEFWRQQQLCFFQWWPLR